MTVFIEHSIFDILSALIGMPTNDAEHLIMYLASTMIGGLFILVILYLFVAFPKLFTRK